MRAFSPVPPWVWNAQNFRSLKSAEKLVFLYLITSPHQSSAGVARIPLAYATADLQLPRGVFAGALVELRKAELIDFDADTDEIVILDWWRFNTPGNNAKWRAAIDKTHAGVISPRLRAVAVTGYRRGTGLSVLGDNNVTPLDALKTVRNKHNV
jgi:hypothetical protein